LRVILSNFGHRFINEQIKIYSEKAIIDNELMNILYQINKHTFLEIEQNRIYDDLIKSGFLEIDENSDLNTIIFKYKKNPLEHVKRVVFEFTTLCNFNCAHCRNGYIQKTTETDIEKLKSVSDAFNLLNIKRYDFIGGEVTKFGDNWLQLAKHININQNKIVTVYSNGWWLEDENFTAAGKFYKNDTEYLEDLKQNGVTHILFSIDGYEEYHDKSRNHKGLYKRIFNSLKRIKEIGINPRITALLFKSIDTKTAQAFADIATQIYDLPEYLHVNSLIMHLMQDDTNHFSNFIDIGNGSNIRENKYRIDNISMRWLQCKAFFRPSPSLRIMANGNLSVCPLLDVGEDFGSIHNSNIIDLLNNFQNSFLYKLHANNEIQSYLKYLDKSIFGEYYDHICTLRVILSLIAKQVNLEENITPEKILEINKKIAKYSGNYLS
jgi:MoaA/NifB/PqqE/SkfB family radical SAM enzyme